jgi:acyl-[acyl-carrier-protein]-phospholipid O-acyltransferase/long-chain-fatty-acid--[acyl-carrier-protein] ligase
MLLHHQFIHIARQHGPRLAVVDRTTNRRLTYHKALTAALVLARHMASYDEGFVGIMLPNSAASILAILATLISGRIPVLINYSAGAAQNAVYAQRKCGFRTIVTARVVLERLKCPHVAGMAFVEDIVGRVSLADKVRGAMRAGRSAERLLRTVAGGSEDDPAVVLFTSGSESDPKAVPLSHRNITANIEGVASVWKYSAEDVLLANLPYFHVFGSTLNLWLPLFFGMTIVTAANPLDFKSVCTAIREEKVVYVGGTPSFLAGYLEASAPGDFASVRMVLTGGDKCPDSLREGYRRKHGVEVYEGYGTTETSPIISVNVPGSSKPGSAGRPLPNLNVRIENDETGNACVPGQRGKILVKGDSVMRGYFDDLEQTSLSLRCGWYDTGDMGYLDEDGFLWHVGRLKRFVKIHGEMVSLVRVEDILQRCVSADIECCVVELPDPARGARIVAVTSKPVDERAVLKRMSEELTNLAMPRQFLIVDELPKMGSGKVDVRKVTDMVRDRLQQ